MHSAIILVSISCCFVILQIIKLAFLRFDTEREYDLVKVFEGRNTSTPKLGEFSGETSPNYVVSTTGYLYVYFETDLKITKTGFNLKYTATELCRLFN